MSGVFNHWEDSYILKKYAQKIREIENVKLHKPLSIFSLKANLQIGLIIFQLFQNKELKEKSL